MGGPTSGAVLGISGDFHDSAAAVVIDGVVAAAAEEERFTRRKHEPSLPRHAMAWCLEEAGIAPGELEHVVFYEKPFTVYERILVTNARVGPRGFPAFADAMSSWSRSKLWVAYRIERILRDLHQPAARVRFVEHHQSHAGAAFFPSPFEQAAVVVVDGVGEWATSSIGHGRAGQVEIIEEVHFPNSIGLLYSAMTAFCGFEVNDGEYKLMGLAPYGEPRYRDALRQVAELAPDGSIRLDQRWFDYRAGRNMVRGRMAELLDGPPRQAHEPLTQREADIARSVQGIVEEAVLATARHARDLTGESQVCLGGGVAYNCVANARLRAEGVFDDLWVQPAAGDAGSAMGAALWYAHHDLGQERPAGLGPAAMPSMFLGPAYDDPEIERWLDQADVAHATAGSYAEVCDTVAALLADGCTVGWFQGRMELGPRALGHRSILADARDVTMIERLNRSVKQREPFRPFAPAVLAEAAPEWFDLDGPRPYMIETAQVAAPRRLDVDPEQDRGDDFAARLALARSTLPACTHVDGSARVQTVSSADNPEFHALLTAFDRLTGCPVLLNTSFNRAGEPIVRTPADAYRCFLEVGLDVLVLGRSVIRAAVGRRAA